MTACTANSGRMYRPWMKSAPGSAKHEEFEGVQKQHEARGAGEPEEHHAALLRRCAPPAHHKPCSREEKNPEQDVEEGPRKVRVHPAPGHPIHVDPQPADAVPVEDVRLEERSRARPSPPEPRTRRPCRSATQASTRAPAIAGQRERPGWPGAMSASTSRPSASDAEGEEDWQAEEERRLAQDADCSRTARARPARCVGAR